MTRRRFALAVSALAWLALAWLGLWAAEPAGAEDFQALVGKAGRVQLSRGSESLGEFGAGLYDLQWSSTEAAADSRKTDTAQARYLRIAVPRGGEVTGEAAIAADGDALCAQYVFTPAQDVALNSLHISVDFGIAALAGGRWIADERSGTFPQDFGQVQLFQDSIRSLTLELPAGGRLCWTFPEPITVLLQDNRQWGPSFSVRIFRAAASQPFAQGVPVEIGFSLSASGGLSVEHDTPVTIVAGQDWIPLALELDILPGSALDFSTLGLQDAPAGKHGWLQADEEGNFFFERQPGKPVQFYGVNFCFSAHYITHEQSDRLADRLVRLGYNTVRLHHYEGELTEATPDRTDLNPQKLDQLDYLVAACFRRGIYVTTDLFVSRPVNVAPFLPDSVSAHSEAMNRFKVLAALNPAAFENWKAFSRNLLEHVNPYTQRAYKDEPGLAWLALINEGNLTNFLSLARDIPDYRAAWNGFLAERYGDRAALAAAWGSALNSGEDPGQGTVTLDGSVHGPQLRDRDLVLFLTQVERDFLLRATAFLRDELGVRALVTNMNGWTNHAVTQQVRAAMSFVDDHFYVDHPRFLEQSWRLPSRCPNTSPIAGGASGGRHLAFTRLWNKPFTVSEYNYSGPGRYRGVGGILTGALGAIQGWDAIWRFAYSHSRDNLFQPGRLDYFNMASDPLSQAAERASICLFLRGDMQAAPHSVAVAMTEADWGRPPAQIPSLAPSWHWAAWLTRVGTRVVADPARTLPHDVLLPLGWATPADAFANAAEAGDPYQIRREELLELLRQRGILAADNPTDPGKNVFQCETGEITIDAPRDCLTLDTARTAGGFAPAGQTIRTEHGVAISIRNTAATVWVSALDGQPIRASRRLLVTHLTDLQNTDIRYAERARQTLLDWGRLPHLVRAGQAEVRVQLADPAAYRVWALATSGQRLAEVPCRSSGGELSFTADVAGSGEHGAVLCYEIACP